MTSSRWKCERCGAGVELGIESIGAPGCCGRPMHQIEGQTPRFGAEKPLRDMDPRSLSERRAIPVPDDENSTSRRRRQHRREWIANYLRAHPTASVDTAVARFLESLQRACVECGDTFAPTRPGRARFCSAKCRSRHARRQVSR